MNRQEGASVRKMEVSGISRSLSSFHAVCSEKKNMFQVSSFIRSPQFTPAHLQFSNHPTTMEKIKEVLEMRLPNPIDCLFEHPSTGAAQVLLPMVYNIGSSENI